MVAVLVTALMIVATVAGVVAAQREGDEQSSSRMGWARATGYWFCTILVTYELTAGALWDLLRIEYVKGMLAHLGYPQYLLLILGVWRIPGALTLLVPRFPRLKEWAYAGAFFDCTGAAASHFLVGGRAAAWVFPLIFAGLTLTSWAMRPASRSLQNTVDPAPPRAAAWVVSVLTVTAMVVVAFFTLPKGAAAM